MWEKSLIKKVRTLSKKYTLLNISKITGIKYRKFLINCKLYKIKHNFWDKNNLNKLKKLCQQGKTYQEIANIFNKKKLSIIRICNKYKIKNIKNKYKWTKNEDKLLIKLIKQDKTTIFIANIFNCKLARIHMRLRWLKMNKYKKIIKFWTKKEIILLKKLVKKGKNYQQIAKILNRKYSSVLDKIYKLRLKPKKYNIIIKKNFSYGEISGSMFSKIFNCAYKRNIPFKITIKQIWKLFKKQHGKCALTGEKIYCDKNKFKFKKTASLDRIDYRKGYTLDNIQWVHKTINTMKWTLNKEELLKWAEKLYKYNN